MLIPEKSTAKSDTYRNRNGSYTTIASTVAVNFEGAHGAWEKIDTTVVPKADGRLHPSANPLAVSLAGRATGDWVGASALATVSLSSGQSVGFGLLGAAAVEATVEGSKATYAGVLPNTDLTLEPTPSGVKDTIILRSPAAANSWVFPLALDGVTAELDESGSVDLIDATGTAVGVIPAGFMADSSFDPLRGTMTSSQAVTYELTTVDGVTALRVTADRAWLDDPKRVYPVRVDPWTDWFKDSDDAFVDNDTTGPSEQNGTDLAVGTYDGGDHIARSFLKFDDFNTLVSGHKVTGARISLYLSWTFDCNHPTGLNVWQVTSPWTGAGLSTQGLWGPSTGAYMGGAVPSTNYPACTNTSADRSVGAWFDVPLDPAVFNLWSVDPRTNNGLALVAVSESGSGSSYGWKRITSRDYADPAYAPAAAFDFIDVPAQVNTVSPQVGSTVTTLTPEVGVDAVDPDNFPGDGLRYQFQVYDGQTKVADSGLTSSSTFTLPSGVLAWGKTYSWFAIVDDGGSPTQNDTNPYIFTTEPPQPLVTSSLAQNGAQGFAQDGRNYTTSATDVAIPGVGPALVVQRSYNSLDPRVGAAFGAGWSSVFDARATERLDSGGSLQTVVVTYPSGQEVAFGKDAAGTFTPPAGRFATLSTVSGGYQLADKDGTTYVFTASTGQSGQYAITSVADASGRTLSFTVDVSGLVVAATAASGRVLHLSWATPAGATKAHVSTVSTDPATPGDSATISTWTYSYSGDLLTKVCPPTSSTACSTYTYGTSTAHPTTVLNTGPRSYWRLGETAGAPTAASAVPDNGGADNGAYIGGVTLGQAGPLAGSTAKAVTFPGGSGSAVTLPRTVLATNTNLSVSMWFKTAGAGPLLGESNQAFGTAQPGYTAPPLYVGIDGKLRGAFPLAPVAAQVVGLAGKCLDNLSGSSVNGNRIYLYSCNGGTNSQMWTWLPDGTLRIAGKCLDIEGGGTASGTHVQLWECLDGGNQIWEFVNGSLRNPDSGRCLDVPGFNSDDAAVQLSIYDCNSFSNQLWSAPPLPTPITSTPTVADGAWHHAVLAASGTGQTLYLDGVVVGSLSGGVNHFSTAYPMIGAGYVSGAWPSQQTPGGWTSFDGSIAEVAIWDRPVSAAEASLLYTTGAAAARPLTGVIRPSGNPTATIAYKGDTGTVSQVSDENGGVWQLSDPVVAGSYQVHASAVLAAGPSDYWRLADHGAGVIQAVNMVTNQVNGGAAYYSGVTTGMSPGPFDDVGSSVDTTAATFNGTSSYLTLPGADVVHSSATSIGMWFTLAPGQSGVLYGYQIGPIPNESTLGWVPALYVGTDGKLRGQHWNGGSNPITSANPVNDNAWHHVVLASGSDSQDLYLDGLKIGTLAGALSDFGATSAQIGAGQWYLWPGSGSNHVSFWPGLIAEVSFYRKQLNPSQVAAQFAARQASTGGLARTLSVTDPGSHQLTYSYDMLGRKIAEVDARGKKTQYGYGANGYLHTVTDPNGNVTTTEQDARGNTTMSMTCQKFSLGEAAGCSKVRFTYWPDAVTTKLTPDARNDVLLTRRDARSVDANDNTYQTTLDYDPAGNRISVTDPLGRVTHTTYTTQTTPASGGGVTPAGLPLTVTTPGGAVQTMQYYATGDVARMTDAAGKVTNYTYDALGHLLTQTEITGAYPGGLATTLTYDLVGRVTSSTEPSVTNRVTGAVHTAVTAIVYSVDGQTLSQTVTDATGGDASRTASFTYNNFGQQVTATDPAGKTSSVQYDAFGRIVEETDANGRVVLSTYDEKGHLTKTTVKDYTGDPNDPSAPAPLDITTRTYDDAGRLLTVKDAMGWLTTYTYTDNDLVLTVTRSDPSRGLSFVQIENTYDKAGNVVETTTNDGATTTAYTVDTAGRTTSSTVDPGGLDRTTTQTLSPDDHVLNTTLTGPGGTVVSSTDTLYDPLGRALATSRTNTTGPAPVARWKLDETTGTAAADSAGNSSATTTGGVTWSSEHGGSAVFDGVSGAIGTSGPVVDTSRSFTVAAWVKLTSTPTESKTAVSQDGTLHSGFFLGYDEGPHTWRMFMCHPNQASPCVATESAEPATTNQWVHLTGVYDREAGKVRLYVNEAMTEEDWSPQPGADGPLRIGRCMWDSSPCGYWPGSIGDVQVYQKALTGGEIDAIRAGAAPAVGAGVVRTSWKRDQSGLVTSQTDPRANVTDYSLDEAGRVAVVTSPAVLAEVNGGTALASRPVTYTGYDTFGSVTESKDANGNVSVTAYDAAGRPVSTTLPNYTPPGSSTPITALMTRTYDNIGQPLTVTDPLNHTTSYVYTQLGTVASVTTPNLGVTRYAYDYVGDLLSTVDAIGATRSATYDYLGRMETSTVTDR